MLVRNGKMGSHRRTTKTDEEIDDSLYSRQRYVLGDDAMKKLAKANVFIMGMDGLGVEIAKNVVLSGVKSVTIKDDTIASISDLGTQFFLRKEDIDDKKTRAAACVQRLAELNPHVTVNITDNDLINGDLEYLKDFQCVVLIDCPLGLQLKINAFCREQDPQIKFISASVFGVYSSLMCDFGDSFEATDHNGVEPSEFLIGHITKGNPAIITTLDSKNHSLDNNCVIAIKEVYGMTELNGKCFTVEFDSPHAVRINCDTTTYGEYTHGGIALEKKQPKYFEFRPLEAQLKSPTISISDWGKCDTIMVNFLIAISMFSFLDTYGRKPNINDYTAFFEIASKLNDGLTEKVENLADKLTCNSLRSIQHQFAPLCAALGGIASQEVLKAVTGKFSPLDNWLLLDVTELINGPAAETLDSNSRYMPLHGCIGEELSKKLANSKLFMVGCGAIGCEMLKNLALLGVGADDHGAITITDNDLIEKSNLNRQFLFRKHHIQKPKSVIAAKSAREINGDITIEAKQDKVWPATENIYDDGFFQSCDIVVNALDNIEARKYMDSRCVANRKALIDTGTLGPKGHVQVVVPFMTECYSSQSDPADEEIPYCTLKSFPQSIDHTIQWARDKFGSSFSSKPSSFNKFWKKYGTTKKLKEILDRSQSVPDEFVASVSLLMKRPKSWTACIKMARMRFEKYFNHMAEQLLHVFPSDHIMKDGTLFWQSPKRPPNPIVFSADNEGHMNFIESTAKLIARVYGVEIDDEVSVKDVACSVKVSGFSPKNKQIALNDEEAKEIEAQPPDTGKIKALQQYLIKFAESDEDLANETLTMFPETFEKDDDSNSHIDFITAASNLRAEMYNIEPVDRFKTKRIAGKIIPAIATTTAAIAGLATIELVKIIAKYPIEKMRNYFLNLAVSMLVPFIPMAVNTTKIKDGLEFSIWDRWDVQGNDKFTLREFVNHFKTNYDLNVSMVVHGVKIIYLPFYDGHGEKLPKKMVDLLEPIEGEKYMDLTIGFESGQEDLEDLPCPSVRYIF